MALYHVLALDKPNALPLRLATRDAHIAYMSSLGSIRRLAAPLLADDGKAMIGSVLILEAQDRAGLQALLDSDPYTQAGLFGSVDIRVFGGKLDPPA